MNLTEQQIKSIQNKIVKVKKALTSDKRRWGGFYDDSRGLRYLPPQYYLKLQDYSGALRYFNWFNKKFPDDSGYPDFLFEWVITLFYKGKIKEAEQKAITAHLSNKYYFNKFFNKPTLRTQEKHFSNWETSEMIDFVYSSTQEQFSEFARWLEQFVASEKFATLVLKYNELEKQLSKEDTVFGRSEIRSQMNKIQYGE